MQHIKDVELDHIREAQGVIKEHIIGTPLNYSRNCSQLTGANIYLKMENQQRTGSFKIRGALNKIANLSPEEKVKGVVACSAGNHAQGVALAAALFGLDSKVVMPVSSPLVKQEATRGYGAQVVVSGATFEDSYAKSQEIMKGEGRVFVHPYEDPYIVAGQGTLALEILEDFSRTDAGSMDRIYVPVGGGGLISGIAKGVKSLSPEVKIIGVVSESAVGMAELFRTGTYVPVDYISTIAEGTAVKTPSPSIYEHFIKPYVDDVVVVSEAEVARAMVFLLERAKTVVEGSGALTLAGAIKNKEHIIGQNVVCLLSGGNVDLNLIAKIIEKGLSENGRLARVSVVINDNPGQLQRLTQLMAEQRANILQVEHRRLDASLGLHQARIDFFLEINTRKHLDAIIEKLNSVCLVVRG